KSFRTRLQVQRRFLCNRPSLAHSWVTRWCRVYCTPSTFRSAALTVRGSRLRACTWRKLPNLVLPEENRVKEKELRDGGRSRHRNRWFPRSASVPQFLNSPISLWKIRNSNFVGIHCSRFTKGTRTNRRK